MNDAALLSRRTAAHFRIAALLTAVACLAGVVFPQPSLEIQGLIAGLAIAVLGFPHGALDPLVASLRESSEGRARTLRFFSAYLALALAVVGLWVLSAPLGLALFLVSSTVHFGEGDAPQTLPRGRRRWSVIAHGGAPIILPSALHPESVGEVFGWLLMQPGSSIAEWLVRYGPWCLAAWFGAAAAAYLGRSGPLERRSVIELVVLAAAFAILPPLLSFSVYFCVWHSVRHLMAVDTVLGRGMRSRGLVVGLAILAATAILVAVGHWGASVGATAPGAIRTIFIALAALTPPHMLVTSKLMVRLRS